MLLVRLHILGVDEDVIEVHNDTDIQHVSKDDVDNVLECCRGISEAKGHYQPLARPIARMEHSLPLIAQSNLD